MPAARTEFTISKVQLVVASAVLAFAAGCASVGSSGEGPRTGGTGRMGGPSGRLLGTAIPDASELYLDNGLMAASGGVPFVGRIAYFASTKSDSTLALVSISLPARSLSFVREGDRYRAGYNVVADMRSSSGVVRVVDANEAVRVFSIQETQRNDESVIFQRFFLVKPGDYRITVAVRDQAAGRSSSYDGNVVVPNARDRGLSTVLAVHESEARESAGSIPKLIASPRATNIFGRDSVFHAYVEAYGGAEGNILRYDVVNELGTTLLVDSVALTGDDALSSANVRIPVTSVGIGVGRVRFWRPGAVDTVDTPLFVGFGDDLPVASFADMLNYLRFYAKPERLSALRNAAEDQRGELWSKFLADTDPNPNTARHEGLQEYFQRVRTANDRYRGELSAGWMTDRGKVFLTLGEPDQLSSGANAEIFGRARTFVWRYQRFSLELLFVDRTGLGRWTLDPNSEVEFNLLAQTERAG